MTISCQENPLAAWSLLLSQRKHFLNKLFARVLIAPNQQETMEMWDEVLSSKGAQSKRTSGYRMSELEDIGFHWESPNLSLNAVFRPGIDTPTASLKFNGFDIVSMAESPILIDEKQDKKNTPPLPNSPVSGRPTQILLLLRSRAFGTRIESVSDKVNRNLFE